MGKAAATLGMGPAARLEAGTDETIGQVLTAWRQRRSRIAAAFHHRRELDRQRADLFKSHDTALGRDTGCRC